jgi:hypothetical protein
MKVEQEAVSLAIQADVPPLLVGAPGTGKSRSLDMIAAALGSHCEDCGTSAELVIASIRDQTDFSGMPVVIDGQLNLAPMPWVKHVIKMCQTCQYAIVFLDELSNTPVSLHGPLMQVVLDKRSGDTILPKNVRFVLAMNPPDQAAGGWHISAPLANRLCWLPSWQADLNLWSIGMIGGFEQVTACIKAPEHWREQIIPTRVEICAFLKRFPQHFNKLPESEEARSGPWPSSRTWDMAARLKAIARASGAELATEITLVSGAVGSSVAGEFYSWLKDLDIPDPEELIKDPTLLKLPEGRTDIAFAILSNVAAAYARKVSLKRWQQSWEIMRIAAEQVGADVGAASVKILINNKKADFSYDTKQIAPYQKLIQAANIM